MTLTWVFVFIILIIILVRSVKSLDIIVEITEAWLLLVLWLVAHSDYWLVILEGGARLLLVGLDLTLFLVLLLCWRCPLVLQVAWSVLGWCLLCGSICDCAGASICRAWLDFSGHWFYTHIKGLLMDIQQTYSKFMRMVTSLTSSDLFKVRRL